jgi:plasmid stabilization system protein ParE
LRIIWSPEAADDFEAAIAYLAARNPPAARRLASAMFALIERLASEPLDGPACALRTGESVRGWPLPPFRVYYDRTSDALRIVRIYDQRREPIAR